MIYPIVVIDVSGIPERKLYCLNVISMGIGGARKEREKIAHSP